MTEADPASDDADNSPRMTRTTVGVVLVDTAGRVLMQLRDDIPRIADPGCWVNPGGEIDPGESPADGARRELFEETGYRVGPLTPAYERTLVRAEGSREYQYYFVGRYDGVQPLMCYEGQELRFLAPDVLPSLKTSPDLAAIILDILARVPVPDTA